MVDPVDLAAETAWPEDQDPAEVTVLKGGKLRWCVDGQPILRGVPDCGVETPAEGPWTVVRRGEPGTRRVSLEKLSTVQGALSWLLSVGEEVREGRGPLERLFRAMILLDELRERIRPESDEEWAAVPRQLPFIVIVADELADLMMTAGKDVEQHIIRLAQKSRADGIHLILATQKPTVDVITGLIKSNLPARIAFQVASRTDSRVVLDEMGADRLLGNGDMLFLSPGTSMLLRGQGTFLSEDEVRKVMTHVAASGGPSYVPELVQRRSADSRDPDEEYGLYDAAVRFVFSTERGSASLLQRKFAIGYTRASRLIDMMAEEGVLDALEKYVESKPELKKIGAEMKSAAEKLIRESE